MLHRTSGRWLVIAAWCFVGSVVWAAGTTAFAYMRAHPERQLGGDGFLLPTPSAAAIAWTGFYTGLLASVAELLRAAAVVCCVLGAIRYAFELTGRPLPQPPPPDNG